MPATPRTPLTARRRSAAAALLLVLSGGVLVGCSTPSDAGSAGPASTAATPGGTATEATSDGTTAAQPEALQAPSQASSQAPSQDASATTDEAGPLITVVDFAYEVPASVAPGAVVEVRNDDVETHTLTSADAGAFAVTVPVDGTGTFVAPAEPGDYRFVCLLHGGMEGVITVR